MASYVIEGGYSLQGSIRPQGAKNEALQIISAVLLTPEVVTIHNIPNILDVNNLIDLLRHIGVKVTRLNDEGSYTFQADEVNIDYLHSEEFLNRSRALRGSILMAGALLGRFGYAIFPKPGGDKIGRRRLDTHFVGFVSLGATFTYTQESHFYTVTAQKLEGNDILLDEASVTGTANIVMAASLAKGTTTLYNAACEPYLQQLCKMLNQMGANIQGVGSNKLIIQGVDKLNGCTHQILPDMIEIGSWIGMAAMTQSELTIKDAGWEHLGIIPSVFERLGISLERRGEDIYIPAHTQGYEIQTFIDGSILTISDAPWPGFTPDLLSIILVTAIQARGEVLIHQKMFESRLFFVDKLIDMGAKIILCDPHRAVVIGNDFRSQLRATTMTSPDIRAGIALLIAALSAKGTSTIHNIEQIDRGYERIEERLQAIGAKIMRA